MGRTGGDNRSAGAEGEGAEMSEVVQVERNGGVATVRMNRPDRLNAYNPEMGKALLSAVSEVSVDPSVRCVVLTGEGKAFSAGGDVEFMAAFREEGHGKFLELAIAAARADRLAAESAETGDRRGQRRRRGSGVLDGAGVRHGGGDGFRAVHARVPEHRALPRRRDDVLPRAGAGHPAGDGDDALLEGPLRGAGRRVGAGPAGDPRRGVRGADRRDR